MDAGDADEKSDVDINDDDDDDDDLQLWAKKKGWGSATIGTKRHHRHQCPRSSQAPNTTPHLISVSKV